MITVITDSRRRMDMTMNVADIDRRRFIDGSNLNNASYFSSILEEAYACGLLSESDMADIQLQCIDLLSDKCKKFTSGDSSSIRVETAESIMKSIFFTIGLYLRSLPDPDHAAEKIKTTRISELYQRGRKAVNIKFSTARHLYELVKKNKTITCSNSYNSTICESGIGIFFRSYDMEYAAHEAPCSIDYQLCIAVDDYTGVEYMLKYLEALYLENMFCMCFSKENIHYLLSGYEKRYKDLLINIFESVLTAAIGCVMSGRSVRELNLSKDDVGYLYSEISGLDSPTFMRRLQQASEDVCEELGIKSPQLRCYIKKCVPKIASAVNCALKTKTLGSVFVTQYSQDPEHGIEFISGKKMDDQEYRALVEELVSCRHLSDKLAIIKENVRSFDDIDDILTDVQLEAEEITAVLGTFGDAELAAMISRHPYRSDVQGVELSEQEHSLRQCLERYVGKLPGDRQRRVFDIAGRLADGS